MNSKSWRYLFVLGYLCLLSSTAVQAFWLLPKPMSQHPASDDTAEIRGGDLIYKITGSGGIKVSMPHALGRIVTAGDTYEIHIDGSAISASNGFDTSNVATDFTASSGKAYFVSASATCLLPSATQAQGKEIVVCNKIAGGSIAYATTDGQTISGQASDSVTNSTPYKIDRFISDGSNWFKE